MGEGIKDGTKAIDIVANLYTDEVVRMRPSWYQNFYQKKFNRQTIKKMDRVGIVQRSNGA